MNKLIFRALFTLAYLSFCSLDAIAEIEERGFSVAMERQDIVQGNIPFLGQWGPVQDAHLIKISMPSAAGNLVASFVKSGFTTADCGNASRVVTLRAGQSTTADQIKEIYGVSRVPANSSRIYFVACAGSSSPNQDIPRFFISIRYEKEIDEGDDEIPPPPPVKTVSYEQVGQARIYSALCQQLHSNVGCSMPFSCPTGYALTDIRAACDLENGSVKSLPGWGVVQVVRQSDKVNKGRCRVADIAVSRASARISSTTASKSNFSLSCKEHDENGGDCSINAQFQCQKIDLDAKEVIPFDCTVSGNNAGCTKAVTCPSGHIAWNARASCNLETPQRKALPDWGVLEIKRQSDKKSKGSPYCSINNTKVLFNQKGLSVANAQELQITCQEHDKNGGDCNINGELECVKLVLDGPQDLRSAPVLELSTSAGNHE